MTSVLKSYKAGDYDWTDPTIRFPNVKKHFEQGTTVYIDEDFKELTDYMEKIRKAIISDNAQITQFIIEDLALVLQIIFGKSYRYGTEMAAQAKIQPFIFQVFIFCIELLPRDLPGIFEILQLLLNNSANYYTYNTIYKPRDVVDELYRKYQLIFSICPVTKSVHDEGSYPLESSYELELEKVLGLRDPSSNALPVKAATGVKYPGTNFIKTSCVYQKISIVYLLNLNYFIQVGGLDALKQHMRSMTNSITGLLPSINILNNLSNFVEDEYYQEDILPFLIQVLKALPAALNEEEIKLAKKEDMINLFQVLKNVFKSVNNKHAVSETLTLYELEILLICLKSQYMEKRIFAITTLGEKISEAERNQEEFDSLQKHIDKPKNDGKEEEEQISNDAPPQTPESIHWFTKDNYLKWLEDHQILNVLLGESSHAELLKRSSPLFRFLFRNNRVSLENVDAICDLAVEKHDTYRKHILNILANLAELMDIDQLQYLFNKLRSLPPQEMDQDILQLIKTIGNNTSQSASDKKEKDGEKSPGSKGDKDKDGGSPWKESSYYEKEDGSGEHSYKITINNEERRMNEDIEARRSDMESLMGSDMVFEEPKKKKPEIDAKKLEEIRVKGEQLAKEIAEFLWKIVIDGKSNKGVNAQLVSNATSVLKDMVSDKLKKERLSFVEKAVIAIGQNLAVSESFEILQQNLSGSFPIQKHDGSFLVSKRDFILFLESEYSITKTLFNSIILLKSDLVNSLSQPPNKPAKLEPSSDKDPDSGTSKKRLTLLEAAPSGNQSDKDYFGIYLKEVEGRLKFVRTLKTNSYEKLELKHAKLLWEVLVENALYEAERDLFFTQFNSIVYCGGDEAKILNDDVINFAFFDILLGIDFSSYTLQIFYCFEEFFKHINKHCDLIKIEYNNFKVKSLDLIGFDFLWELYLHCPDMKVVGKAQKFLLKLSTQLTEKSKSFTFIETCVKHIENAYTAIKDKSSSDHDARQRISRSLDFIFDFLQEYGELHIQKGSHNPADAINVIILNQLTGAQAPKKFNLTLYKTMSVSEAKALIASKLNPPVAPKEIVLISRGSIIKEEDSGRDEIGVKVQNGQTIWCSKNSSADDTEMPAIPLIGPQMPVPNDDAPALLEKIENIQALIPGLDTEFVKFVLKRKNFDADDTAASLLDPDLQDFFRGQYETEEKQEKSREVVAYKPAGGSSGDKGSEESMSEKLSNNNDTLALFFNLLSLHIAEIEGKVWSLLANLPLNAKIYETLRDIFDLSEEEAFNVDLPAIDWSSILDPTTSMSKLLYSLQIINSLTSCAIINSNDSQLTQKALWRQNFLRRDGFSYLQSFLLQFPETGLIKQDSSKETLHNTDAKTISLILNVLKVYIHSALVATSSKPQQELLQETLEFPKIDKNVAVYPQSPVKEKTRPPTPTFGSPTNRNEEAEAGHDGDTHKFGDEINGSSGANKENEGIIKYIGPVDEFEQLVEVMKEKDNDLVGKALQYLNLKDMVAKVLNVIKASLEAIDNDKDLAGVVETAFGFLLPCFVAYPMLLQTLYDYHGTGQILRTIFFESQQEQVRKKLTHMISFLSLHFSEIMQTEQHLVKAMETDSTAHTESYEQGSSSQDAEESLLKTKGDAVIHANKHPSSPQDFFLKTLLPLVYSCQTSERINLEYFEMITSLIRISDRETISTITDVSRLYAFAIRFIIDRPIIEDRSAEIEDKILSGFLLLAKTLVEIEPSLQELFTNNDDNPILDEFSLKNLNILKTLYEFLFYLPTENDKSESALGPPKCKHKRTRFNVFNLMRALCNNNKNNLATALDLLADNHQKLPSFVMEGPTSTTSMINSELKNTTGYVGLKNLGCTCYMNSLIQQFFMVNPLRNALMNSEVKIKLKANNIEGQASDAPNSSGENVAQEQYVMLSEISKDVYEANKKEIQAQLNDSTLYQLQILMAHLAESASEYIYPNQFFNSIKTINGEKIVLNVQQDVNEFFNTLCDKLDMCMKSTPQQSVLPELIGGLLSHEIISLEKDYPYYAEREEAYLTLPLDIKNKRDISEALQLFIKEDILEGDNKYFCEKYDRKIKVMKRCCIKTLPNTLSITLKRFDFDFGLMQKVKINDYFEFPFTFNIKPWTIEGLKDQIPPEANYEPPEHPDSYYQYELVGILVHSGTADGGHYYSFIKDRSGASRGWFEFNDNQVKPFDIKNIRNECYGAEGSGGSGSVYDDFDLTNIKSAYILFYDRCVPEPTNSYIQYKDQGVPDLLSNAIWNENLELLKTKYFYNIDYFNFMMDLIKFYEFPPVNNVPKNYSEASQLEFINSGSELVVVEGSRRTEEHQSKEQKQQTDVDNEEKTDAYWEHVKVLKLALILASEMYMKNRNAEGFADWMKLIEGVVTKFKPGAIWFIKYIIRNPEFMRLLYVDGVSSTVKDAAKELLSKGIEDVAKIESSYFTEEDVVVVKTGQNAEGKTVRKSSLARFLKSLVQKFWLNNEMDFSKPIEHIPLVTTMVKLNQIVAHFLIEEGLLMDYFNVYIPMQKILGTSVSVVPAIAKEKDRFSPANSLAIFQTLEALIRSCVTDGMYQTKTLGPTYLFGHQIDWEKVPKLPAKIVKDIQSDEIFRKCFVGMQEKCDNFIQIAQHVAWEDVDVSKRIMTLLISMVCSLVVEVKDMDENMKIVYNLIKLEDSFQEFRVKLLFSEDALKLVTYPRNEDLLIALKKAKDFYSRAQVVLALRWLTNMASEVKAVEDYFLRYAEKFEWVVLFLHELNRTRFLQFYSVDSEYKAKLPNYVKKAYEIIAKILPIWLPQEEEEEKKDNVEIVEEVPEKEKDSSPAKVENEEGEQGEQDIDADLANQQDENGEVAVEADIANV